jgi:hypothetical protein
MIDNLSYAQYSFVCRLHNAAAFPGLTNSDNETGISRETHALFNLPRFWIKRFGAPIWWCTGMFELAHKPKVKQASLRTNSSQHAEASMLVRAMRVDLIQALESERLRKEEAVGFAGGEEDPEHQAAAEGLPEDEAIYLLKPQAHGRGHRVVLPPPVAGGTGDVAGAAEVAAGAAAAGASASAAAASGEPVPAAMPAAAGGDAATAHLTANNCELLNVMLPLLAVYERQRRGEAEGDDAPHRQLSVDIDTLRVHNGMSCYEPAATAGHGKRRLAFSVVCSGAWRGALAGGRFDSIETQVRGERPCGAPRGHMCSSVTLRL